MFQRAGFATDVAVGPHAAMAAFTGRHFDVVVLCHTLTKHESRVVVQELSERAPLARVVRLEHSETCMEYDPQGFLRSVEGRQ